MALMCCTGIPPIDYDGCKRQELDMTLCLRKFGIIKQTNNMENTFQLEVDKHDNVSLVFPFDNDPSSTDMEGSMLRNFIKKAKKAGLLLNTKKSKEEGWQKVARIRING